MVGNVALLWRIPASDWWARAFSPNGYDQFSADDPVLLKFRWHFAPIEDEL